MVTLLVMDFDFTIINEHCGTVFRPLIDQTGQQHLNDAISRVNWIEFLNLVHGKLHSGGFKREDYGETLEKLEFAPGMKELLEHLQSNRNGGLVDCVIISGAISFLIETFLEKTELGGGVHRVLSNLSEFGEDGRLNVKGFHDPPQESCQIHCQPFMCKGLMLDNFIESQEKIHDRKYEKIVYVGDGTNDYCPLRRLRECDVGFVREGHELEKLLNDRHESEEKKALYKLDDIKATVNFYSDASVIMEYVK